MTRLIVGLLLLAAAAACMPRGPVLNTGEQAAVAGTISGRVTMAGSNAPVGARKITAIETATGARHEITTASNGGYTMKVPIGTYRLEIALQPGESIVEAPADLEINTSDLDAGRDFVLTVKPM